MYLTDILIENVGPIERLDLQLPFATNGTPRPAILVGANGSGKTVLLATIADALILMAAPHFQDVVPQMGLGHAYFKILGGSNQRVHTSHALALLGFEHSGVQASYVEKTGKLSHSTIAAAINLRFPGVSWPETENAKTFSGLNPDVVQAICRASALCFWFFTDCSG